MVVIQNLYAKKPEQIPYTEVTNKCELVSL